MNIYSADLIYSKGSNEIILLYKLLKMDNNQKSDFFSKWKEKQINIPLSQKFKLRAGTDPARVLSFCQNINSLSHNILNFLNNSI